MKNNGIRTILSIVGVLVITLAFIACEDSLVTLDLGVRGDYGSIVLNIEMPGAITPSAITDSDTLVVIMSCTDYPSIVRSFDISGGLTSAQIDNIRPGSWTITVHLTDSVTDTILYRGETGLEIEGGAIYDVTIILEGTSGVGIEFPFVIEQVLLDDGLMGTVPSLESPGDVLLSPDETILYVTSNGDDAITVFSLDGTTGRMTWVEDHQDGDAITNDEWLRMAVSADGLSLYEVSFVDGDLTAFTRDVGTGSLTLQDAFSDGSDGLGLSQSMDVVVSLDNEHVYVAGGYGFIVAYDRDTLTGALTEHSRLQIAADIEYGGGYESDVDAYDMKISPDGKNLYIVYRAYYGEDYLAVLSRDTTAGGTFGDIAFVEYHKEGADIVSDGTNVSGMNGVLTVAVAPDGNHVYAGSQYSSYSYVAIFARDSVDGTLTFVDDYFIGGSSEYAGGVVALTNTDMVIVGSGQQSSALFTRDVTTGLITPSKPLNINAETMAVTSDLSRFYVIDYSGDKIFLMEQL